MKVCTDACLFGAWLASLIQEGEIITSTALDIGVGTGLLSMMIAQKSQGLIHGIELDSEAYGQALKNIQESPYKNRCAVSNVSLQEYLPENKFDFVFSNPPFFEGDLRSSVQNKNHAKHDTSLTLHELILFISNHLALNGLGSILIPYNRLAYTKKILEQYQLYVSKEMLVRQTVKSNYFRAMLLFSSKNQSCESVDISIHDEHRTYTEAFQKLLKEYYLYL